VGSAHREQRFWEKFGIETVIRPPRRGEMYSGSFRAAARSPVSESTPVPLLEALESSGCGKKRSSIFVRSVVFLPPEYVFDISMLFLFLFKTLNCLIFVFCRAFFPSGPIVISVDDLGETKGSCPIVNFGSGNEERKP